MQQIINFLIRYKHFLLYLFLLMVSLGFTIQSHSYHQSSFFNSANWLSGNIYEASNGITSYFGLTEENKKLVEENKRLNELLFNLNNEEHSISDSTKLSYAVTSGRVINNSFAKTRNYITIDKGEKDGVKLDMGVVSTKGIVGIVENTSGSYATVQSILNEKSNINAKIKNTDHFGSLIWNAERYDLVQLVDIPRLVKITVGDTIVTGGMSSIFPENILVGTVQKFDLDTANSFYTIDVKLFNDMTNIRNVYVVQNNNRAEIIELETATENEQ